MALFAVSLTFVLKVDAVDAPEPTRELAIHVVRAENEAEARVRGDVIGRARQLSYLNAYGEPVTDEFVEVVEVQLLSGDQLIDGMEVSSWLYQGERLVIEEGWTSGRS